MYNKISYGLTLYTFMTNTIQYNYNIITEVSLDFLNDFRPSHIIRAQVKVILYFFDISYHTHTHTESSSATAVVRFRTGVIILLLFRILR